MTKEETDLVIPKPDTQPGPGLIQLKDAMTELTNPYLILGREQTLAEMSEEEYENS